jgi:hypothetical protein
MRGGATLVVLLLLVFMMLLMAAGAHRGLLFEQRTSANQYRAAQAFEAAEAGLAWALSQLNETDFIDASCAPRPEAVDGQTFRDRFVRAAVRQADSSGSGGLSGLPGTGGSAGSAGPNGSGNPGGSGGSVSPLATGPSCHRDAERATWACGCPAQAPPPRAAGTSTASVWFEVGLQPDTTPGLVQLSASGCVGRAGGGGCSAGDGEFIEAQAQSKLLVGRIAALTADPGAALTVRGAAHLGESPWRLASQSEVAPGLALRAGAEVDAADLTVLGAPGAPTRSLVLDGDPPLHRLTATAMFTTMFRMDKAAWRHQPPVRTVDCGSDCDGALRSALGPAFQHPMVWLGQGLHLREATTLGSPEAPVLLLVDGPVRLEAPVTVHGLVYAMSPDWQAPGGVTVHGAVVAENDLLGAGPARIDHDPALLRRLGERAGTYARVAGSWQDF